MIRSKQIVFLLSLFLLSLLMVGCGSAESSTLALFAPYQGTTIAKGEGFQNDRLTILRSRPVEISDAAIAHLMETDNALERILTLKLFPGVKYVVSFDEPVWHSPDSYTLVGEVIGQPTSEVYLTVNEGEIYMRLATEDGVFLVQYNGQYHEVMELDEAPMAAVEEVEPASVAHGDGGLISGATAAEELELADAQDALGMAEIDVLVIYSSAAEVSAGGEESLENLVNSAFVQTNQSFINSNINIRLYMVEFIEAPYEPDSYSEGLYCITETDDDCLEWVHDSRDTYYADLVVFVVNNNDYCGLSWLVKNFNDYSEQNAFSLVNWRCLSNGYTLSQEIAKNLGSQTDHENAGYEKGALDYSYGYQAPDDTFITIMAKDCGTGTCPRLNYWSSPWYSYNGVLLGVTDYADNARSLNEIGPFAADYRIPPSPPAALTLLTPENQAGLTKAPLLYGWQPEVTATQYRLIIQLYDTGDVLLDETISAAQICTDTLCTYDPGLDLAGNDYTWKVAGINSIGLGEFGSGHFFSIEFDPPVLQTPATGGSIYVQRPVFQWESIDAATYYYFQLYQENGTVVDLQSLLTADVCTASVCSYQMDSFIPTGNYQWRVSGVKTIPGQWSDLQPFTILPLGVPALTSPLDLIITFDRQPVLDWESAAGASGYDLQYSTNSEFSDPVTFNLTETSFTPTTELALGEWYWRVRSSLEDTRGAWSEVWQFDILEDPFWTREFGYSTGWSDPDTPRVVADVNGDGIGDLIGFGPQEVLVALETGEEFSASQQWIAAYGSDASAGGWNGENTIRTAADVNGDGKADIVGFSEFGVLVSLSSGTSFGNPEYWVMGFGSDPAAGGWSSVDNIRVVEDVNGDGMADVVGFGDTSVWVSLSTGSSFEPAAVWANGFGKVLGGWDGIQNPRTIADVNGDGCGDIVGFSNWGVLVSLSNACSGLNSFTLPDYWAYGFAYQLGGWDSTQHIRTLADVDGDGDEDLIGFGDYGVLVSLSNGSNAFGAPEYWIMGYAIQNGGWEVNLHPRMVVDVNGDGLGDVVGFATGGVIVELSDGTKFK